MTYLKTSTFVVTLMFASTAVDCGDDESEPGGESSSSSTSGAGGEGGAGGQAEKPILISTKIGMPAWEIVDYHQVTGLWGDDQNSFDTALETIQMMLPAPNHGPHPALGIGPGASHAPPYDEEFTQSLTALGWKDSQAFTLEEAATPNAIFATWMVIPSAGSPLGSSPDFAMGPILPNSIFPVHVVADGLNDGVETTLNVTFNVPPLDANLDPPFDVEGHSHFPIFFIRGLDNLPTSIGKRGWHVTMVDQDGNGWDLTTEFDVSP